MVAHAGAGLADGDRTAFFLRDSSAARVAISPAVARPRERLETVVHTVARVSSPPVRTVSRAAGAAGARDRSRGRLRPANFAHHPVTRR
jgi:hypothetical protein